MMIKDIKIGVYYKIQRQAWYKCEILYEMARNDMCLECDVFMLGGNVFQCMAMVLWIELFLFWDLRIKLFRYVVMKFLMMRGGESFLKMR